MQVRIARRALVDVLLVEDSPADARLFHLAAEGKPIRVSLARDGEAAFERLGSPDLEGGPPMRLVVLDLGLPVASGLELLRRLKGSEALRAIPVVVLSCSACAKDVAEAYGLGAASYVVKPADLDGYLRTIGPLIEYWSSRVLLPGRAPLP
jgi:CheY-like chemotaxis protein